MSFSDDKRIEPLTFKSLGEIVAPLTKGLSETYASKLEEEADRLETEAETKRYVARLIRDGVA